MADQSLQAPDDTKKANRYSSQYSSHFHGANIGGLNLNVNLGTIQQYIVDGKIVKIEIHSNPFSNVPFERDADFVGRDSVLDDIETALQPTQTNSHSRAALVGPPGVGKTQIAVEYAARLREDRPYVWVLWVDARSEESFIESYRKIAKEAEIPGWEDAKTSTLPDLVFEWLKNPQVSPWLLILDNNDDANLLFTPRLTETGKPGKSLVSYIPRTPNGSVLITTRDDKAGKGLGASATIHVLPVDPSAAKTLFRKKVTWESVEDADLDRLLKKLEYLPLAITHAAAYMLQNNSTVRAYLSLLEKESEFVNLLAEEVNEERSSAISWSVMSSWTVSFEFLLSREPQSVELLQMICFLDRHNIPGTLLQRGDDETAFASKMLGPLLRFCFLSRVKSQTTGDVYEMHSLVHLFSSIWAKKRGASKYAAMALRAVADHFPPADNPDDDICQQLSPHARAVLGATATATAYETHEPDDKKTRAELLHNAASYEIDLGNFKLAEAWVDEAWQIRKEQLGEDNTKTLESMHNLAMACYEAGKSNEAVRRQKEVVERLGKTAEETGSMLLVAKNALVSYYLDVGKWMEAESLAKEVVEASERLGIEEQEDTWDRKMTLIQVWRSTGKHELAQSLVEITIEEKRAQIREDQAEQDQSSVTGEGAAEEEKDEEEGEESSLIQNSYDLADSLLTLALICCDRGMYGKAREYMAQVIQAKTKAHGEAHPSTLRCQIEMARIYQEQGELHEAERLGKQVTAQLVETLGKDHPDTLASWSNLALVYEKLGRLEDAESDNKIVEELSASVLGEDNRLTLLTKGNLASTYRDRGKLNEAADLGEQVLSLRKSVLGRNHPDVLIGITNLALTYQKQGRHEDVRMLFREGGSVEVEVSIGASTRTLAGGVNAGTTSGVFGRLRRRVLGYLGFLVSILYSFWRRRGRAAIFAKVWRAFALSAAALAGTGKGLGRG